MSESKPSELVQSARGLLVCAAAIILGAVLQSTVGNVIGIAGLLGFLYFLLATTWAAAAAGIRRRGQRKRRGSAE